MLVSATVGHGAMASAACLASNAEQQLQVTSVEPEGACAKPTLFLAVGAADIQRPHGKLATGGDPRPARSSTKKLQLMRGEGAASPLLFSRALEARGP